MKFENAFVVQAPVEEVWAALLDVERVAPCMPGAEVLEEIGDDAYKVAIKVKVGPISMTYRGEVEIVERDDAARRATMRAKAKEARGQGTADAHVRMALTEQPDGTHAALETEVQLSGKVAAMGQGVIADVSARLVETFAANLAQMLDADHAVAAPAATTAEAGTANGGRPTAAREPALAASAGRTSGSEAMPPSPASASPPPVPPRPAPAQTSLPVGKLVAGVIAGRLSNPRALGAATAVLAIVFLAIGYAIGRAT